jgi:transposase
MKRSDAITKAGNPHVRRLLAEAAWAYQGIRRIGRQMLYRQEQFPKLGDRGGAPARRR